MIQRHLFWAFLVLLNLPLQAQTKTERATVEWGPEMNDSKDGAFDMVVGYTDDFVYMLVWQKKERFLRKMDASHRIVYQKLLPMEIDKDDHALETVQVLDVGSWSSPATSIKRRTSTLCTCGRSARRVSRPWVGCSGWR
ncbi:MAG: hypothetical protein IPG11_16815 [Flavobacteriales bacterium]|nr:hypothetical protein [Flavobacteriales bacterium]